MKFCQKNLLEFIAVSVCFVTIQCEQKTHFTFSFEQVLNGEIIQLQ